MEERRISDLHETRITVLEKDVELLQRDVNKHAEVSQRMLDTLNAIREELAGFRGFLKAVTIAVVIAVTSITAVYTIGWLQIPKVSSK